MQPTGPNCSRALTTAQPGSEIVLTGPDYPITSPVTVPPGVILRSAAAQMIFANGLPVKLMPNSGPSSVPVIRPDGEAYEVGDLVELSDGSRISRILIKDHLGRLGNAIAVRARGPNQTTNAQVIECEIENPATQLVGGPDGAVSRAIIITTEPGGTAARIDVAITDTRVRTPGPGSGIFAINFGSSSEISLTIERCRIQGNLDAAGGITKANSLAGTGTQDSQVTIVSRDNLFEAGTGPLAWQLSGGGQAPLPTFVPGVTSRNSLIMTSERDRIAGAWSIGIIATGGRKYFAAGSPVNQCSLTLIATDLNIDNSGPQPVTDVRLSGCLAGSPTQPGIEFTVGDDNKATITLANTTAGGTTANRYADAMFLSGVPLSAVHAGTGNVLKFTGNRNSFMASNPSLDPPPDNEFF